MVGPLCQLLSITLLLSLIAVSSLLVSSETQFFKNLLSPSRPCSKCNLFSSVLQISSNYAKYSPDPNPVPSLKVTLAHSQGHSFYRKPNAFTCYHQILLRSEPCDSETQNILNGNNEINRVLTWKDCFGLKVNGTTPY